MLCERLCSGVSAVKGGVTDGDARSGRVAGQSTKLGWAWWCAWRCAGLCSGAGGSNGTHRERRGLMRVVGRVMVVRRAGGAGLPDGEGGGWS